MKGLEIFPEKIKSRIQVTDSCWIWTGSKNNHGYGLLKLPGDRKWSMAHRVTFEALKFKIPSGLVIDHLCRNTSCVNPEHLEAVSQKTNVLRSVSHVALNAKSTQCKHGHEYTPDNTVVGYSGGRTFRRCRTCKILDQRNRRLKRKGKSL